jgi:phenylpropionate dioxygenase-like ring-hydroxylating dioxygenase large terminal subunit
VHDKDISKLVENQPHHFSLAQKFYRDPDIYQRDIARIFMNSWLYAGHQSEIPNAGDWFLFELADESVIIVRSTGNEINALLNVCRHRGSRICVENKGCSKILTCPYHAWSYDLRGQLLAAAHMDESFDKTGISLQKIHVEILAGMIFVNFAEQPSSFDPVREGLADRLAPYQLENARVAHRQTYSIESNWKLAVENYCECYHCAPSHPEYARGHSLAWPARRTDDLHEEVLSRAEVCGLGADFVQRIHLNAPGFGADFAFERYAMLDDHVTGSENGKPVAPLLGSIRDYDGGTTDLNVGPVTFALMYCDYVIIYRFTPLSIDQTECDITWLVNGEAQEGKDYDLDKLTWLWDVTTIADKTIIERNQQGVNSRFYRPGPLSTMEDYLWSFLSWYLEAMKKPG